jgi:hypothetical protein
MTVIKRTKKLKEQMKRLGVAEPFKKPPPLELVDDRPSDPVVEAVRADLLERSRIGIEKYGVTLARTDLSLRDWLQHAYEETLDQANYLKRAIMEIDNERSKQHFKP